MSALYHGGVRRLKVGERILPPKNTGAPAAGDFGAYAEGVYRLDRVYLTVDLDCARLYALLYPPRGKGWVYEVEPIGDAEVDPYWLGESGGSVCAPAARIVRVIERDVRTLHGLTRHQVLAGLAA